MRCRALRTLSLAIAVMLPLAAPAASGGDIELDAATHERDAGAEPTLAPVPDPPIEQGDVATAYAELLDRLRDGGLVLLVRHERTTLDPTPDLENPMPSGCERERNLSEVGRASAAAFGEVLDALAVPISVVMTSPYCRNVEHARLAFGRVDRITPALIGPDGQDRSFDDVREDLYRIVDGLDFTAGNAVLIAHGGNMMALTKTMLDEGDALVLRPREGGAFEVIARMPAARWDELARAIKRRASS